MYKRLLYAFIFGLLIVLPRVAKADHFEYLPQDPSYYNAVAGGDPEMWMYQDWYIYSIYQGADSWRWIDWKADTAIRTEFAQAVSDWSNVDNALFIDWHDWRDANNIATTIDLEGKVGVCPGLTIPHAACFTVNSWTGVYPGGAYRWQTAKIYVNLNNVLYVPQPGPTWNSAAKKQVIAHELGHAYGLHERYDDNNPAGFFCNGSESTIMDAMVVSVNTWTHCDPISGPTATDQNRISTMYLGGSYNLQAASWNGSNLVASWKDRTWSDWALNLEYRKWNGTSWVTMGTDNHLPFIAAHETPANRTIGTSKDVKSLWGTGWYMVCGKGWNGTRDSGAAAYSLITCSSSVWVP